MEKNYKIELTSANVTNVLKNPYLEASDWGWQIDPPGLKYTLNHLYDRYEMPLFILENGIGAIDELNEDGTVHDGYRIDYLSAHFKEMLEAIMEWSFLGILCRDVLILSHPEHLK